MSAVDEITVRSMAKSLTDSGCRLGDERAVIRVLNAAGFGKGDVLSLADEAACRAKNFKQGESK